MPHTTYPSIVHNCKRERVSATSYAPTPSAGLCYAKSQLWHRSPRAFCWPLLTAKSQQWHRGNPVVAQKKGAPHRLM